MKLKLHITSLYLIITLTISVSAFSQNAGISATGATPPNVAAGLDINFSNKGLLIPRIQLISTTSFAPLSAHVAGMLIYNTSSISDVKPGLYFNNGSKWISTNLPEGTTAGMYYWDETTSEWVIIPNGTTGQKLTLNAEGIPIWEN